MKKNNGLFIHIIILGLAASPLAIAEGEQAETSMAPPTSQHSDIDTQNTTKITNNRVIPNPEQARIKALKEELKQNHLTHQINLLEAQGVSFLTLYRQALTGDSQGCVVLLPANHQHPDWPSVISPLRNLLPKYSWCTLSIELPDIPQHTKTTQTTGSKQQLPNQAIVFARIQEAISDAKTKGHTKFVFLGYGSGAAYAMHFLAENKAQGDALVLINIASSYSINDYDLAQDLQKIEQPVLDYYRDNTHESIRFAMWRKQAANQSNSEKDRFIQLDSMTRTRGITDNQDQIIQRVRGFLKQYTQQSEQQKSLPEYKKGLFYQSP